MHDLEFEHLHVNAEDAAVNEVAWAADNVELMTVGIDIGSSTSHLMFARVHLQPPARGRAVEPILVVVERKVLWQSPILLTPYRSDYTIDVDELAGFIGGCYAFAGIEREKVDSGAVILTGEALKRRNARAIADLFSRGSGQVRLRLGRAPHGMPDGGAWLRRHCALAWARRHRSQRRYRRRDHQICPDRERPHPRDLRACGRRPPCGRGGAGRTDARRASRAGDRAGVRHRSAPASPAPPSGSQADRRAHGPHDHGHHRPAATRRARAAPDGPPSPGRASLPTSASMR